MSSLSFIKKISNVEKLLAEMSFLTMKLWNSFRGTVLGFFLQYRIFTALTEMSEAQLKSGIVPPGCLDFKPAELVELCQRFEHPVAVFFLCEPYST